MSGGFRWQSVHHREHVMPYKNKQVVCLCCEYILWHFTSPPLRSIFSSGRQLCQTVEDLLTLTGSDEAVQADVFLFALGETASLTLSWLILGPGLSQCQCLYLPLHTLSLQEGHACNYWCILHSGCSWGSRLQCPLTHEMLQCVLWTKSVRRRYVYIFATVDTQASSKAWLGFWVWIRPHPCYPTSTSKT